MRLIDAIPVEHETRLAFVGAGGKTTAMFRLAAEFCAGGGSCALVSATTHLAIEQLSWGDRYDQIETLEDVRKLSTEELHGVVVLAGAEVEDGRAAGLALEMIAAVERLACEIDAPLLIEADGSRRKPLKAPASHEPVIPPFVRSVVVSAGMQGVGKLLGADWVHRPELFSALSGLSLGQPVTLEALASVLTASGGGLKDIPEGARRVALLNQSDTDELAAAASRMARCLLPEYGQVVAARLAQAGEQEALAAYRRVAGVVLAGGGSSRMGQVKQLLDWQGKPFVRAVAETALAAGLSPVIVVTGADGERVGAACAGLEVRLVENPRWAEGQSTSVRAGVAALPIDPPDEVGAAVFLLADQPQVPVTLVEGLALEYARTLAPIVATLVEDRRANPVLFDRTVFPDLAQVSGDAGGRQVFSRHKVAYFPWLDRRVGWDVDTMEDYQRLKGE